jgi:hypothetical protein
MDGHAHGSSLSCCLAGADGSRGSGRGRGRDQQNRLQTVLGRQSHHARHSPRAQEDRSGRPRYSATAGPAGHRDLCCLAPNPHRMRQRQATELVLVRLLSRLFGAATPATWMSVSTSGRTVLHVVGNGNSDRQCMAADAVPTAATAPTVANRAVAHSRCQLENQRSMSRVSHPSVLAGIGPGTSASARLRAGPGDGLCAAHLADAPELGHLGGRMPPPAEWRPVHSRVTRRRPDHAAERLGTESRPEPGLRLPHRGLTWCPDPRAGRRRAGRHQVGSAARNWVGHRLQRRQGRPRRRQTDQAAPMSAASTAPAGDTSSRVL